MIAVIAVLTILPSKKTIYIGNKKFYFLPGQTKAFMCC